MAAMVEVDLSSVAVHVAVANSLNLKPKPYIYIAYFKFKPTKSITNRNGYFPQNCCWFQFAIECFAPLN